MRRTDSYIRDGRLYRGGSYRSPFRWKRFLLLAAGTAVLVIANLSALRDLDAVERQNRQTKKYAVPSMFSLRSRPHVTNYGLFSLQETFGSLIFRGAFLTVRCEFKNTDAGFFCEEMAKRYCTGKPLLWDPKDRVHTCHRTLVAFVIFVWCVFFCFEGRPFRRSALQIPVVGPLLSLFYQPSLVYDIVALNSFVRPALSDLNRILLRLHRDSWLMILEDPDRSFLFLAFVLVIVIGATINGIATHLSRKQVIGINSVVATCLAYSSQINISRTAVFHFFNQPVTSVHTFWTMFALNLLHQHSIERDLVPDIITWLVGGWVGSLFAQYQLGHQLWWGDVLHFTGLI